MGDSSKFNPFDGELKVATEQLSVATAKRNILSDKLDWHQSLSPEILNQRLADAISSETRLKSIVEKLSCSVDEIEVEIQEHRQRKKSLFNPSNWIDKEQRNLRAELSELIRRRDGIAETRDKRKKHLEDCIRRVSQIEAEAKRFNEFDAASHRKHLVEANEAVESLNSEVDRLKERKQEIDRVISPLTEEIDRKQRDIEAASKTIELANRYQTKLESAQNSYERAMVHQDCEVQFGDGSPNKVVNKTTRKIRGLERDLVKLAERARDLAHRHARKIRKLILDGNNLCYESGSTFVGLRPVVRLAEVLAQEYEVVIVFDAAIRNMVRHNDEEIRQHFPKNLVIHVVATRNTADETILQAAAGDSEAYIISNDRFSDYPEKEVVQNNRLIRHEILDGNLLVSDLELSVDYR